MTWELGLWFRIILIYFPLLCIVTDWLVTEGLLPPRWTSATLWSREKSPEAFVQTKGYKKSAHRKYDQNPAANRKPPNFLLIIFVMPFHIKKVWDSQQKQTESGTVQYLATIPRDQVTSLMWPFQLRSHSSEKERLNMYREMNLTQCQWSNNDGCDLWSSGSINGSQYFSVINTKQPYVSCLSIGLEHSGH